MSIKQFVTRFLVLILFLIGISACGDKAEISVIESAETKTSVLEPTVTVAPLLIPSETPVPFLFTLSDRPMLEIEGFSSGSFIMGYAVLDVDHDGLDDLLYFGVKWVNQESGFVNDPTELTVLLNKGEKGFVVGTKTIFPSGAPTLVHGRDAKSADLNGDGVADMVFVGHGFDKDPFPGEENVLLLSQADGSYIDKSNQLNNPVLGFSHSMALGDIENDGDIDLIVVDVWGGNSSPGVYLMKNDGSGQFDTNKILGASGYYKWASSELVDLNNDDYLDLVLGGDSSSSISAVFWNRGDGSFSSEYTELPSADPFFIVADILALDLDNDGFQDLILSLTKEKPFYEGSFLHVLMNREGEEFVESPTKNFLDRNTAGKWVMRMEKTDIDLDGDIDLVMLYDLPDSNYTQLLWLNNGEGIFELLPLEEEMRGTMIPIDVDADGDKDLLVVVVPFFGNQNQVQRWQILINNTK
ncbi:MAG: VCBS repeat-containing protein [Chloroflexi bacterium]|jgi:hypothetical protein|nr:VCBS repeat-containing protein [Chloroflexota bacterium]MBT3670102.1 VCBS repeat-containing protein [Chloroflexota bacterium]MBT4001732.1 VCBS repeat-containing protein [Chloroflexota bacterium]MBT4306696.1 VCBS repeat-containing protein [Chloroflexota bacterium]MBT4532988.1 VCBS repeat-containing protein [Chloroflexota bacterium]